MGANGADVLVSTIGRQSSLHFTADDLDEFVRTEGAALRVEPEQPPPPVGPLDRRAVGQLRVALAHRLLPAARPAWPVCFCGIQTLKGEKWGGSR